MLFFRKLDASKLFSKIPFFQMKYIFLLLFLFSLTFGFSQEQDSLLSKYSNGKIPKIGVVLSGGGAKGLAHIGVLKVLEEEGVKIDFIGGTSMGAMVGGLYASGYNAEQLDSIFRVTDFDRVVQDNLPRSVKSFYDKENDEKYAITFPFQRMKFGIPIALSQGQNVYNLFSRLLYDTRFVTDFNQLPIPFLCIATNIETGEEVVLNKGNLAQAIVASGSFPTLFSPVEINGKFLTDGGIVNNYPIEEVRKMGADIIIGVDVQTSLMTKEEIASAAQVVMQIINFQMLDTMEEKKQSTDIYIQPNITGYNVVSFNQGAEIIKNGKIATEQYRETFREIARIQQAPKKEKKIFSDDGFLNHISNIEIRGTKNYSRSYVLGKLRFKNDEVISFESFNEGFNRLNATQNFRSINYYFEQEENKEDKLIVDLREKEIKTFIRFGLHYDELYKSGLLINITHKNVLTRNDVISGDLILGDNIRYNLDYYIDNGFYWSFGFRSRFNQFKTDIPSNFSDYIPDLDGLKNINVKYYDFTNQAYFQTIFRQIYSVGAGVEHKIIDINSETITIDGQDFNDVYKSSNFLSAYGYIAIDTYDKKYFPKNGIYFDGNFKWILNSTVLGSNNFGKYSITQGSFGYAKTVFNNLTFTLNNEIGFTLGESDGLLNFLLGGYGYNTINNFRHFYGYDFLSITGNSYIKGVIGVDYEIFRKNHLNFHANFANAGNNIFNRLDTWFTSPAYSGYAFGYGMETIIGPIEVKYSWSPEVRQNFWWVNVGFWF